MIELTSRYSLLLSFIFLTFSFISAFYFYKNVNLNNFTKYFLISIKAAAFFILLFLFIEPSVLALLNVSRDRLNIVLIDNSRSNYLTYDNKPKSAYIKNVYNQLDFLEKTNNTFMFSATNSFKEFSNIDSVDANGFETNLFSALESLRQRFPENNFNSVTIISDGVFNSGGVPLTSVKTFQCPFIAIGIGDTAQQRDIVLNKVLFNEKAFVETDNKINVEINAYGFINEKLSMGLTREGIPIVMKSVDINSNNWTGAVTFDIRESEPGTVRYSVFVQNKPVEVTYKNNHFDFMVKYLKNEVNILYISAGPSYDNGLVSAILKRIKNYNVIIKTVKSNNDFYEGPLDFKTFGDLSAVFLLGFPPPQFNSEMVSSLAERIKTLNIPLIFFSAKKTDYGKLEIFDELIPFTTSKSNRDESSFFLRSTNRENQPEQNVFKEIVSAPELFQNINGAIPKPGGEVLLLSKNTGEPALILRNTAKNKAAAFLGYGFWRWTLNPKHNYESLIEKFVLEVINITLMKDRKLKLTIIPDKDIFDYTEEAKFTAEIYDDNYNIIRNATIKARILSGHNIVKNDQNFTVADNKYYLNIGKLEPGDYRIEAEAELNENFYAKDEERFACDTLNLEFHETRSNFENLKLLSGNTNGRFLSVNDNLDTLNDFIRAIAANNEGARVSRFVHINLWENKYILLVAILLFSIEWIIRKRVNIP
jgi:hypothetical protein